MYNQEALERRRCTATKKNGEPCQAFALWRTAVQRCAAHTYRKRYPTGHPWRTYRTRYTPCHCVAYQWPHRPGGGLCRWPDLPHRRLLTPAGTHEWPRFRGELATVTRLLKRRWR
jgi:hypothetical protein